MTSNKIRYIHYSPDEYLAGVCGLLNAEEQGTYWLICTLIMSHGGQVENDPKRFGRLLCIGPAKAKRIIEKLIKMDKIQENIAENVRFLTQKRAKSELNLAENRVKTAQDNGKKGGRTKGELNENNDLPKAGGLFSEKLTTNHKPLTKNHRKEEERYIDQNELFENWWDGYPNKKSKKKAKSVFVGILKRKEATPEQLFEGVFKYLSSQSVKDGFIKHPTTWLNGACWKDEEAEKQKSLTDKIRDI